MASDDITVPSDRGHGPGTPRRTCGWRHRVSQRTILIVIVTAVAAFLILSPFTSPFGFIRDTDGDGHSDSSDMYPDDPLRWDDLLAFGFFSVSGNNWTFHIETLNGATRVSTVDILLTVMVYADSPNSVPAFLRTPVSEWGDGTYSHGIAFVDVEQTGFLDPGDSFIVDTSVYETGSELWLLERAGDYTFLVGGLIFSS